MTLFFVTFFLIYGSMHLYAFMKAKAAFAFSVRASLGVGFFMLIMLFAPVLVRFSEKAGFESFARLMSYTGYIWLGILFLFLSAAVVIDFYRLLVSAAGFILRRNFSSLAVSAPYAFFVPLAFSIVIAIYGYFEARNIRTETVVIQSPRIPAEAGSIKIVQITDVHIGLIVREERLKRILDAVRKAAPDILVSTGDLVDGQIDNLSHLAELLQEVKPRYGKFAITGNHEFYAGIDQALEFTEKAGFTLLQGQGQTVGGLINIAGVDDTQASAYGGFHGVSEQQLLSGFSNNLFTLFLKHRPLVNKEVIDLFDLQLSGHVHKGQIFPFSILTWLYYPTQAGFAELSERSGLYVSRGSGTWGPPIRFLSPPEVTLIELVPAN
ncbi:MAG: metallophosphoesterase [Thermodesulfovibrionales bacterium]|nr:metallophosphoesterase [Thermodesulfovibrionales bacterium]